MSKWTAEENDMLRKLFAEGLSYTQMAAAIGRTKGAAISRAIKLGLGSRGEAHFKRMASRSAKMRKYKKKEKQPSKPKHFSLKRTTLRERKPPMFLRVVNAPDSKPVPLIERTGCCYPTTSEGPHLFCNAQTEGRDYCEFHYSVMYKRRAA